MALSAIEYWREGRSSATDRVEEFRRIARELKEEVSEYLETHHDN